MYVPGALKNIGEALLHEPGWLAFQRSRHLSYTRQKSTLRLYDNRTINRATNRTAGNTLLMRIASNLYIKMAAPGKLSLFM